MARGDVQNIYTYLLKYYRTYCASTVSGRCEWIIHNFIFANMTNSVFSSIGERIAGKKIPQKIINVRFVDPQAPNACTYYFSDLYAPIVHVSIPNIVRRNLHRCCKLMGSVKSIVSVTAQSARLIAQVLLRLVTKNVYNLDTRTDCRRFVGTYMISWFTYSYGYFGHFVWGFFFFFHPNYHGRFLVIHGSNPRYLRCVRFSRQESLGAGFFPQ